MFYLDTVRIAERGWWKLKRRGFFFFFFARVVGRSGKAVLSCLGFCLMCVEE